MTERMSTQHAAKQFRVHERTIRRWIQSGKLKAEQIEGRWFVQVEDENVRGNGQPVQDNARDDGQDARLIEHLTDEISHLREQLARRDEQIDHLTQLLAMQSKTTAALIEQLDTSRAMIEDMRRRKLPLLKRVFRWT